jgi:hypothetical protein
LVDKSIAAISAAIEIYNKPVIAHREETFAILSCAAWELLMKARLVQASGNKMDSIFEKERPLRRDGRPAARHRIKTNSAGNPITIGLKDAIGRTRALPERALDPQCADNIELLFEIRNNAVHFVNDDQGLAAAVHGLAVAAVRNYVNTLAEWFGEDLSAHRFAVLPLSFDPDAPGLVLPGARRGRAIEALQRYIDAAAARAPAEPGRYAVALRIETRMVGTRARDAIPIRQGRGGNVAQIALNDEALLERYPLSYNALCRCLKERVPDIKFGPRFYEIYRGLLNEPRLVHERRLHPGNPKSAKAKFFAIGMIDAVLDRM